MKEQNILSFLTINLTVIELQKIGDAKLATKLQGILQNNELEKSKKHNRKEDITTSFFTITLDEGDLEKLVDLFLELEVKHLTSKGETTGAASLYSDIGSEWANVKPII